MSRLLLFNQNWTERRIANWRSPVLLIHGDDDRNVPFQELITPDEIHDLLRWSDWVRAYRATAEFFDRKFPSSGEGH